MHSKIVPKTFFTSMHNSDAKPRLFQLKDEGVIQVSFKYQNESFSKFLLYCNAPTPIGKDSSTTCLRYRESSPSLQVIPINEYGWTIVSLPHIIQDFTETDRKIVVYNHFILQEIETSVLSSQSSPLHSLLISRGNKVPSIH